MTTKTIKEMIGVVFTKVEVDSAKEHMVFYSEDGREFIFSHQQDCCESVSIEDIVGDLSDLENSEMLVAEESTSETDPPPQYDYNPESYTWTYYKFATKKGYVDVRWFGSSNGYYGETADLVIVDKKEDFAKIAEKLDLN